MFTRFILMLSFAAGYSAVQSQDISREAWYAVPDAQGVQVVNVECGAKFVDPPEIVVKSNRPVELRVRTSDEAQEFLTDLNPGVGRAIGKQPTPHRFNPNANGRFAIGCQKQGGGQNPNNGKKLGLLTVVPDNGVN